MTFDEYVILLFRNGFTIRIYMNNIKIELPSGVAQIIGELNKAGYEAYAVGGCVRDSILGRDPHDWDITTSAMPLEVKGIFKRTVDTGIKHGTVTVLLGDEGFEVTTFRVDGEYSDHRHPTDVKFTRNLREDLLRSMLWHTVRKPVLWIYTAVWMILKIRS